MVCFTTNLNYKYRSPVKILGTKRVFFPVASTIHRRCLILVAVKESLPWRKEEAADHILTGMLLEVSLEPWSCPCTAAVRALQCCCCSPPIAIICPSLATLLLPKSHPRRKSRPTRRRGKEPCRMPRIKATSQSNHRHDVC